MAAQAAIARQRLATIQAGRGVAGKLEAALGTVGMRFRTPPVGSPPVIPPGTPVSPVPVVGTGTTPPPGSPAPVTPAPSTPTQSLTLNADLYDASEMTVTFVASGGTPGGPWTIIANPSTPSADGATSVVDYGSFAFDQGGFGSTTIPVVPGPSPWYAAVDLTTGVTSPFVQAPPGAVVPLSVVPGPEGTTFAISGGTPGGAFQVLATPPPPAFSPASAEIVAVGTFDANGDGSFAVTDISPGSVFYNARDETTGATALGWYESATGTIVAD